MSCGGGLIPCEFELAFQKWIDGDFEGFMALFDEDILWIVNMDGITSPFASSAVGKEDLRWRLQHMMDVFSIQSFNVESIEHGMECCRAVVRLVYVHRRAGEPLAAMVRFTGWAKDGRLVRFEESADAAYVAAFTRFVRYLEENQNGA